MPGRSYKDNIYYKGARSGRPAAITEEEVEKMEEAALIGCTMSEIALYVGVSESCLYSFLKDNQEFKDRLDLLRNDTTLKARQSVRQSIIEGDPITSKWYLERKASNEFTVKHDIDINAAGSLTIEDKEESLKSFLTALTGSQTDSNSKSEE